MHCRLWPAFGLRGCCKPPPTKCIDYRSLSRFSFSQIIVHKLLVLWKSMSDCGSEHITKRLKGLLVPTFCLTHTFAAQGVFLTFGCCCVKPAAGCAGIAVLLGITFAFELHCITLTMFPLQLRMQIIGTQRRRNFQVNRCTCRPV